MPPKAPVVCCTTKLAEPIGLVVPKPTKPLRQVGPAKVLAPLMVCAPEVWTKSVELSPSSRSVLRLATRALDVTAKGAPADVKEGAALKVLAAEMVCGVLRLPTLAERRASGTV